MIFPAAGNNWKKNNIYNEKKNEKKKLVQKFELGYCPIVLQEKDCIAGWVSFVLQYEVYCKLSGC